MATKGLRTKKPSFDYPDHQKAPHDANPEEDPQEIQVWEVAHEPFPNDPLAEQQVDKNPRKQHGSKDVEVYFPYPPKYKRC